MKAVIFQDPEICVPGWVVDLDSFLRWVDSDDVPEHVRIDYLQGEIWIDSALSEEQVFTHVRIKTELNCVLALLAKADRQLIYLADGLRIMNHEVGLSAVPDGTVIVRDALRTGRVNLIRGAEKGIRAAGRFAGFGDRGR